MQTDAAESFVTVENFKNSSVPALPFRKTWPLKAQGLRPKAMQVAWSGPRQRVHHKLERVQLRPWPLSF